MKAETEHALAAGNGYWLVPFANFQADCPYLVGSYEYVAHGLQRLVQKGINAFIFDVPASEEEFLHLSQALCRSDIISATSRR
jgi:alkanesulfonate monooxygenase